MGAAMGELGQVRAARRSGAVPRGFLYWLPLEIVLTLLCGLVYVGVQQDLRQGANDPQIQMAQDAAAQIEEGAQPSAVVGAAKVDMAGSLSPYLIVYGAAGNIVASSAQLNGSVPQLPNGVLDYVRSAGEERVTWQPQRDVRVAAVVMRVGGGRGGFVLAGRSLAEVEKRESQIMTTAGLAWAVGSVGSLLAMLVASWASTAFSRPA